MTSSEVYRNMHQSYIRQHHIPKAFLQNFTDAEGKIWMIRRQGSPIRTTVENVAVKKNQYKTLHDKQPEEYESLLAGLEDWLRPSIKQVVLEEILPSDPKKQLELRLFTSLQHARSPSTRKFMSSVVLPHLANKFPTNFEIISQMNLDPEYDLPIFMDLYKTIAQDLELLPLSLIRSEDSYFVCPDDPVFLQSNSQGKIALGLFPISSRLLLQFGGSEDKSSYEPISADAKKVLQWNQDSVYDSVAVYGRSQKAVEAAAKGWLTQS